MKLKNIALPKFKSSAQKYKKVWVATYIEVTDPSVSDVSVYDYNPTKEELKPVDDWLLISLIEVTL